MSTPTLESLLTELPKEEVAEQLRRFDFLAELNAQESARLTASVRQQFYDVGEVVFRQDEPGGELVLVVEGKVELLGRDQDGNEVMRRVVGAGEVMGRHAAVTGAHHIATAVVLEPTRLFFVDGADVARLIAVHPDIRRRLIRSDVAARLRAFPAFASLSLPQVQWLADLARRVEFDAGQVILEPGQAADGLYFIDQGRVRIQHPGGTREVRPNGAVLGVESVVYEGVESAQVLALTQVKLFRLPVDAARWLVERYPEMERDLRGPDIVARLKETPVFSNLGDELLRDLAGYVSQNFYPPAKTVVQQGEPGDSYLILDRGEAIVRAVDEHGEETPSYIPEGASFGETSLLVGEPHDVTIETLTPCVWLRLHRDDFQRFQVRHPGIVNRLSLKAETRRKVETPRYPWMDENETIVFDRRRHWIALLSGLVAPALLAAGLSLAGFALWLLLPAMVWEIYLGISVPLFLIVLTWYVIDWLNDRFIVTTKRVVHLERVLYLSEQRHEAPLDKIQNIDITRDLMSNLIGYGNIFVRTAATEGTITFDWVSDPEQVRSLIFREQNRMQAGVAAGGRQAIRESLVSRLGLTVDMVAPERVVPDKPKPKHRRLRTPQQVRLPSLRLIPHTQWREGDALYWRKHWLHYLYTVGRPIIVIGLLFAILILSALSSPLLPFLAPWMIVPSTLGIFFTVAWLLWVIDDWTNDKYILTMDRVVDVDKRPLFFQEERREAPLDRIQNVELDVPGPLAHLFDYGHITIRTAASPGILEFKWVPAPRRVQTELFRRIELARMQQDRLRELPDWFEAYHRAQMTLQVGANANSRL